MGCTSHGNLPHEQLPESGVVDRNLKVFGASNLYAVGSGAFVTGGAVQPTLTIAALSLRLADMLTGATPPV